MEEIKCARCPTRSSPPSFYPRTSLFVPKLGEVPVLQGDPKWLPPAVLNFVVSQAAIMCPSAIWLCNGSVFEGNSLRELLVKQGVLEKLSAYENVYLSRTDPRDTARVEKQTFVSTADRREVEAARSSTTECELARWMSRSQLDVEMRNRFPGCMRGRTMFVVPFSMGPIAGLYSKNAVQLTDSPYVVINMSIVTRVSSSVWDSLAAGPFVRCVHSVGCPRPIHRPTVHGWLCDTDRILIAHRLPELEVFSYGSGYGGNSLLGKKCLALRIGSYLGWKEGWLAEHAALLSLTNPDGKEIFFCFSAPSGVGKTVLATMIPTLPGWKLKILGDDITWLRFNKNGVLCAMAPENGMFGIASDVKSDSGKNVIEMIKRNSLLVNAASTNKGRFMWSGLENTLEKDEQVLNWKGEQWKPGQPLSHSNCRFTASTSAALNVHPEWDGNLVPISAYIWGSRRPDAFPLVMQSNTWQAGVTLAATMRTQVGSVSDMKSKELVHDPMSMRPFMSYNFARYVNHWMSIGKGKKVPPTFHVNWYQSDDQGRAIWPGYGENIRVLEWIFNRVTSQGQTEAVATPVGQLPVKLNLNGLSEQLGQLIQLDKEFWKKEVAAMEELVQREMSEERPAEMVAVLEEMKKGLA